MEESNYSKKIYVILLFISIVLAGALCKTLSSVILPVIISILLSLALYPAVKTLTSKLHFPWFLSVITVILILIIFFAGLSSLLVKGLSTILSEYPRYENRFISIYEIIAKKLNLSFDSDQSLFNNLWNILQIREGVQKIAILLSSGTVSTGKTLLLIILLLSFFMIEINAVKTRVISHIGPEARFDLLEVLRDIISEVSHYLSIKFVISLLTGILVFIFSSIIGLNFPIVWGFVAFIMNFIPTFGSIFSAGITTVFAVLQFYPSVGKVIFVLIYMIAINFTLGNIVEPRIEGKRLGISPFAILVSLSLFGWLWGFIGMIIAVPLTVILKSIFENIPELNLFAVILGETKKDKENNQSESTEEKLETKKSAEKRTLFKKQK